MASLIDLSRERLWTTGARLKNLAGVALERLRRTQLLEFLKDGHGVRTAPHLGVRLAQREQRLWRVRHQLDDALQRLDRAIVFFVQQVNVPQSDKRLREIRLYLQRALEFPARRVALVHIEIGCA